MIVAIDGPAASGKSTVARGAARRLNCIYVDSGALYRGITWSMLRAGASTSNPLTVLPALLNLKWKFSVRDGAVVFSINGEEPGEALRSKEVSEAVSDIAAMPAVRLFVVKQLRKLVKFGSLCMEGRDIGSVVFPKTPYKFYLDAAPEERARRRQAELVAKGDLAQAAGVDGALQARDLKDSRRKTAPLKVADGAYAIDTTGRSLDDVIAILLERIYDLRRPRTEAMVRPGLYRLTCNLLGLGLKTVNNIKVIGLRNVPKTGGLVIASNHASYLDPPAIGSFCRMRTIHFMARDTLFRNPLMGRFLRDVGVIPLDRERGDLKAIKTAIQLLQGGGAVALFPEGTRTPDGSLQPPKPGVGFLVAKGQAPVVPVYIHGSYEAWSKHSGGLKRKPITVVFGQLITQEEIQRLGAGRDAYPLIGELIMQRIAELKEKFLKGEIRE